jgi:hypothetical protein
MARLPYLEADQVAPEYRNMLKRNTNYCAVVRVLATVRIDNEPHYKEVLTQYPIPGVK